MAEDEDVSRERDRIESPSTLSPDLVHVQHLTRVRAL